jgi:hypothetical protein
VRPIAPQRTRPVRVFPLWYLTGVDRALALWSPVHSIGAFGATMYASSTMKIIVEIVWRGFERGRVASIGVFSVARPDAGAASGEAH